MSDKIKRELDTIRSKNNGILDPKAVVDFARNTDTALHSKFEWRDGVAGELYRLHQARNLIRVVVNVSEHDGHPIRAFVSLKSDRYEQGGYRATVDVVDDERLMKQLVEDAKDEMQSFLNKYARLRELAEYNGFILEVEKFAGRFGGEQKTRASA